MMIPTRSDEFSLAMSVNGTYLALVAVSNGTEEDLVLQAQVVGSSPGTPGMSLVIRPYFRLCREC